MKDDVHCYHYSALDVAEQAATLLSLGVPPRSPQPVFPPRMPLDIGSPLPKLVVEQQGTHQRSSSSEFGWYDIEPLLTSRTESSHSGLWNDVEEEKGDAHVDEGLDIRGKENSLPRALERVFCWLEEVEAGHQNSTSGVDETIIDTGVLAALPAPSSSARQKSDKVVASKAVTKADFCLASRNQPSLAIGIYAHRVVCRSKWLPWARSYAEYLVVTGTDTELLSAWRTYSDFSSLADTAKSLRMRRAIQCWHRLEARGTLRKTDPSSLRMAARLLNEFLATLLEELTQADIAVLADFARQPTTYVVVGVEDVGLSTTTTTGSTAAAQPSVSNSPKTAPRRRSSGTISPGGGGFGAAVRHPMKWQMTESALKPAPRIWTGL